MLNLKWIPGTGLLRQAVDATKLIGVIINTKKERALEVYQEKQAQLIPYKGKNATKKMIQVIEEKNPEEIAKLFLPDKAIELAHKANNVYWKVWDIYWFFALLR